MLFLYLTGYIGAYRSQHTAAAGNIFLFNIHSVKRSGKLGSAVFKKKAAVKLSQL